MLYGVGKCSHNANGNKILSQASLHNLSRLIRYATKFVPEEQQQSKIGPSSKPCMTVGYTHDWKTYWIIWDPELQRVRTPIRSLLWWRKQCTHVVSAWTQWHRQD
jgi:hypothetical protein